MVGRSAEFGASSATELPRNRREVEGDYTFASSNDSGG